MKTAFRLRLYPNHRQERKLLRMIEACRQLWNDALAHRKWRWEEKRLSTSYSQQCWILTAEREADPLLGELYSQTGQEVLHRLDKAFKAFFEHRARYPRFKKFSESGSFTYPQAYNGSVRPDAVRKRLFLSKVGNVKAVFHRGMPPSKKLKTCTVIREPNGEWYASLVYEDDKEAPQLQAKFKSPVGVDLGLKSLIATTDGVKIPHPQFLRKAEERLKCLQRSFSRTRKGSKNRDRARRLLAVLSSRVSRQRADFNHKLKRRAGAEARPDRLRGSKGQEHGQKSRARKIHRGRGLGSAPKLLGVQRDTSGEDRGQGATGVFYARVLPLRDIESDPSQCPYL